MENLSEGIFFLEFSRKLIVVSEHRSILTYAFSYISSQINDTLRFSCVGNLAFSKEINEILGIKCKV